MRSVLLAAALAVTACGGDEPPVTVDVPACGTPLGGHWDEGFVLPGASGPGAGVAALLRTPTGIVAGGAFEQVVGVPAQNVARWDGAAWSPLGDGLPGRVQGLALDDGGTLWAVGLAERYEVRTGYLARWDGQRWTMVAEAIDGLSGVVAVTGGVAVHGTFHTVAGIEAAGLAVWDGDTWSARGLAAGSRAWRVVRVPDGFCVGGQLTAVGLPSHSGVACWNGTSWSALGPAVDRLHALARGPDDRWWLASELIDPDAGNSAIRVGYLAEDGTWQFVDGGLVDAGFFPSPTVQAIAFDGDAVVVGGRFVEVGPDRLDARGLARWSPRTGWSSLPAAIPQGQFEIPVRALLADGARVHVAGYFAGLADTLAPGVASIDHDGTVTAWTGATIALAPTGGIADLVPVEGGALVAGRVFAAGIPSSPAAWFDGGWRALPGRPAPWDIHAAAVLADGTPVLSGEFIWRWAGASWTPLVPTRTLGSPVLADLAGSLYYAIHDESATPRATVMRWHDGVTTELGLLDGSVTAFAAFDGQLVAATYRHDGEPGGLSRLHVRRSDGRWEEIDGTLAGSIEIATASPAFGVVVVTSLGELSAWDGSAWRTLAEGPFASVAGCDRGVFTAGYQLGFLDETGWRALTAGPRIFPTRLAVSADGVYVAGGLLGEPGLRLWRHRDR